MSEQDFARIPVTMVEIDQDLCCKKWADTNDCGTCNADGDSPCYNTRETCQSLEDYELGDPLTLKFSMRDRAEGFNDYVIPSVDSVSTSPTRINVGGRQGREKPLGVRSEATITFTDHPHSDLVVDPYIDQRDFNPLERGTFWSKWLRRNPFFINRPVRVREGFAGQSPDEMQTRRYVIERIEGPDSNGAVTLKAQDILRLADNDKAKAPDLSRGALLEPISETATSMTVTGGTLSEYTQYDTQAVRIGDEVIRYTGVSENADGDLEFTGLSRGTDGSEASDHDEEDTVQACLEYTDKEPWRIAYELLTDFGGVTPDFIDLDAWDDEGTTWLSGFFVSRLLTEPVGVNELLGELSEQCLFFIWWDDRQQQIRLKAVAPPIGSVPVLTEDENFRRDSIRIKTRPEERTSEVWVSIRPIDATDIDEERKLYRITRARVDPTAASREEYGERRVYEVFSSWLNTNAQADILTFRLLARYRRPPKYLKFSLDVKDRDLELGQPFDVEYRGFVDETGKPERVRYQLISAHESPPGERIKCEAQQFDFDIDIRPGNWMVEDAPVYTEASEEEQETGFFWSDSDGLMSDNSEGYVWS